MARPGLLVDLRTMIDEARESDAPVRRDGRVQSETHVQDVHLSVIPFRPQQSEGRYFIVLFEAALGVRPVVSAPAEPAVTGQGSAQERELERMKQELANTKAYVQSVVRGARDFV